MPLIVDTYNVLHVTGVLPPELAGIDTDDLIDLITESRYRREETVLVCDGVHRRGQPHGRYGEIRVIYAGVRDGGGREADDVIEQMIARSSVPRRLTVVSSDGRLVKAARRRKCRVLSAEDFLGELGSDNLYRRPSRSHAGRPAAPLGESHIDQWIRVFGLSESDLSIPASHRRPSKRRSDSEEIDMNDIADS